MRWLLLPIILLHVHSGMAQDVLQPRTLFIQLSSKHALASQSITDIIQDVQGGSRIVTVLENTLRGIWMSTVNRLWYHQPAQELGCWFDHCDGLPSQEFTKNGVLKNNGGTLVLDCTREIICFRSEAVMFSQPALRLLTEQRGRFWCSMPAQTLRPDQKMVHLTGNVLSDQAPEIKCLAYRRTGWEERWHVQPASHPVIFYESIPEEDYTLEVKGNREGLDPQATLLTIPVTRHLPCGTAPWFALLLVGAIALICRSIYQRRLNWLRREKELQVRQHESELRLLKSQISPHFLFNTLNNIHSLCVLEPAKASRMVMNLSKMLRYMLYECQGDQVSLTKELDFLAHYVYLQQEKSASQHDIRFAIEGNPAQKQVVPFLLINFVENSFKHSDITINPKGFVNISVTVAADGLTLLAKNTWKPQQTASSGGLGIDNVRRQLQLSYPNRHKLCIEKDAQVHVVQLKIAI